MVGDERATGRGGWSAVSAIPEPASSLRPSGNLRRRLLVSQLVQLLAVGAALLAVAVLAIMVFSVVKRGVRVVSWSFLTSSLPPPSGSPGGIGPALVGTIELVLMATAIAVPLGILTAIYVTELAGARADRALRLVLDLMNGVPTIVTGVFVWRLIVEPMTSNSALAGAVALAIVMTPLVARASIESLALVPATIREAAEALGVARWRTTVGLILPTAAAGITTATILAIARAAGETAPLLFTTSIYGPGLQLNPLKAVPNVPLQIFSMMEAGYPQSVAMAWGAAFVLMAAILIANVGARLLLRRSQRKRGL